jgi:hypothetical protein
MTAREQRIADLKATAATYARVGVQCQAEKKLAIAARFEAMTDEEYSAHQESQNATTTQAMRRSAAKMAAKVCR